MDKIKNQIMKYASDFYEEVREIRRHLHENPELSWEEVNTALYICNKLKEYGIPYQSGIAGTGVVGLIEGKIPGGKCIALRADMDGLPLTEENDVPYKSRVQGKMHACGHDVHMACLLGSARILNNFRDTMKGSIKLIFQPSEETYPGGALGMINEGILDNPGVIHVIGQHVINTLDAGKVGMKAGPYMASTDEVFLTVTGKGGHAATPEQIVDPILIASHIVVALQQIVSRNASPMIPSVVSFGRIIGEGRTNIIPNQVEIAGTIRTYDETWRNKIHSSIMKISTMIAESMGGSCQVRIDQGYPFLHNDEKLTEKIRQTAIDYLGENNVVELEPRMTAEDFSYYAKKVPSVLYRLGIRNEQKGISANLHTSKFDVDERCLETGMGFMAFLALDILMSI